MCVDEQRRPICKGFYVIPPRPSYFHQVTPTPIVIAAWTSLKLVSMECVFHCQDSFHMYRVRWTTACLSTSIWAISKGPINQNDMFEVCYGFVWGGLMAIVIEGNLTTVYIGIWSPDYVLIIQYIFCTFNCSWNKNVVNKFIAHNTFL